MYRLQRDITDGLSDDEHLQPHVLCERCRDICSQSKLLHAVPEKYSVRIGRADYVAGASEDDIEESYQHGTLTEIEESCLKGCFLCGFMYYSNLRSDYYPDDAAWESYMKSSERFQFNIIARDSTRECRIEYEGACSGSIRVFVGDGERAFLVNAPAAMHLWLIR
jgi:hypothetical protein